MTIRSMKWESLGFFFTKSQLSRVGVCFVIDDSCPGSYQNEYFPKRAQRDVCLLQRIHSLYIQPEFFKFITMFALKFHLPPKMDEQISVKQGLVC